MLLGGVLAVFGLELELLAGSAQDGDGLLMGDAGAVAFGQAVQLVQQAGLGELIQEGQLVRALFQHGFDQIFEEILLDVHQLVNVAEGDFRLDHPELGGVGLGVAVLCAEGGAEGVHLREGHGEGFRLQLTGHRQGGGLAEEILVILAGLFGGQGGHGKGVARALGVVGGNEGRMHIEVAAVLEVGVDGHAGHAAHAEHRLEQPCAGAQVGDFPQVLHAVALGLEGVILGAVAFQGDLAGLHLGGGGILVGGHHGAHHGDGRAHPQGLDGLKAVDLAVVDHLGVFEAGAVKEINEAHVFLLAVVADPALQLHLLAVQAGEVFLQGQGRCDFHRDFLLKSA